MHARLALVSLVAMTWFGAFTAAPPASRPPINALRRHEPEKYEISFQVTIQTTAATADAGKRGVFNFDEAPIVLPVIYQGAYSKVFPDMESGSLSLDGQPIDPRLLGMGREENKPFNTHLLRMVVPRFEGVAVQWTISYLTQSWSADIDEARAQQSTWPRNLEWPEEVRDGLQPQWGVESDNAMFADILRSQGGDRIREVSPYIAAKQVVGLCLRNFQINGTGVNRGATGQLQGLRMQGALASIRNPDQLGRWHGTEHDLVCVCVAFLRAAGIPARAIIGMTEEAREGGGQKTTLVSWGEFYIPDSGWASFDPVAMLGHGSGQYMDIASKWPEFGVMEDLNQRAVLAYHFIPPAAVESPNNPALWGWDPRPNKQRFYEQYLNLQMTSRGKGEEDPR